MIITITDDRPQPGEKHWEIDIKQGEDAEKDNYTVGEAIKMLSEVLLANTPSGENNG